MSQGTVDAFRATGKAAGWVDAGRAQRRDEFSHRPKYARENQRFTIGWTEKGELRSFEQTAWMSHRKGKARKVKGGSVDGGSISLPTI